MSNGVEETHMETKAEQIKEMLEIGEVLGQCLGVVYLVYLGIKIDHLANNCTH